MLIIYCKYLYKDDDIWHNFIFESKEYFRHNNEKVTFTSKPKYMNPIKYFREKTNDISTISIEIENREEMSKLTTTTFYWDNQKNYITEKITTKNDEVKEDIFIKKVIDIEDSEDKIISILKLQKINDMYQVQKHYYLNKIQGKITLREKIPTNGYV